jgi:large subunit ribosomal protein L28
MVGSKISHSQRHTKRRFQPNLIDVTLTDANGRRHRMRISAKALRTLSKAPRLK